MNNYKSMSNIQLKVNQIIEDLKLLTLLEASELVSKIDKRKIDKISFIINPKKSSKKSSKKRNLK